MKIAYISASTIPSQTANSIHVMKMCQAMAQEGYSVELSVPAREKKPRGFDEDLFGFYGISLQFPIVWIPAKNWIQRHTYQIESALRARNSGTGLVYTRHLGAAAVSSLLGIPTIYEAHDLPGGKMGPLYFRLFLAGRGFQRLVIISNALRNLLDQRYFFARLKKQVVVSHDGVDLERFYDLPTPPQARRLLGLEQETFTVGYTGNLYPGRGIELILELAKTLSQVSFVIIGGDEASVVRWRSQAEHLRLNNVMFKGFVRNAVLPLYQAACEVLLMPYQRRVAASGGGDIAQVLSPMKMFEYMAVGRLIISSDLPVLREVLNETNAVFCDPEDVNDWRNAIARAIAEDAWTCRLRGQARRDAEQFTWRRRAKKVLAGVDRIA